MFCVMNRIRASEEFRLVLVFGVFGVFGVIVVLMVLVVLVVLVVVFGEFKVRKVIVIARAGFSKLRASVALAHLVTW